MPSERKQLNVRLTDGGVERLNRLVELIGESLGVAQSQSSVVELALALLERHPPTMPSQIVYEGIILPAPRKRGRKPRKPPSA